MPMNPYATPYGVISAIRGTKETIGKMADDYLAEQAAQREGAERMRALDLQEAQMRAQQEISLAQAENQRFQQTQDALRATREEERRARELGLQEQETTANLGLIGARTAALGREEEKARPKPFAETGVWKNWISQVDNPVLKEAIERRHAAMLGTEVTDDQAMEYAMEKLNELPEIQQERWLTDVEQRADESLKQFEGMQPIIDPNRPNPAKQYADYIARQTNGLIEVRPFAVQAGEYTPPPTTMGEFEEAPSRFMPDPNELVKVPLEWGQQAPEGWRVVYEAMPSTKSMYYTPEEENIMAEEQRQVEQKKTELMEILSTYPEINNLPPEQKREAIMAASEGRSLEPWGIGVEQPPPPPPADEVPPQSMAPYKPTSWAEPFGTAGSKIGRGAQAFGRGAFSIPRRIADIYAEEYRR